MRAVIQRVSSASVTIDGEVKSAIGPGLLILLGIGHEDGPVTPSSIVSAIIQANKVPGNTFAQASSIFGAMNPHDSNFSIPPITEVPDYVWSRRYSTSKVPWTWTVLI